MIDESKIVHDYFETGPAAARDAHDRVRAQVSGLWQSNPGSPPRRCRWKRSPWQVALTVGVSVGVAGAGVGLAAAAGAFNSQARSAFHHSAAVHRSQLSPSAHQEPTAGLSTPPTTTADGVTRPGEQLEVTAAGPDGLSMQLWAAREVPTGTCYVVTVSNPGVAAAPGKPAYTPQAECVQNTSVLLSHGPADLDAALWQAPTRARYMITAGRAAGAATVILTAPGGVRIVAPVANGWYVIAVPYSTAISGARTEMARSKTGTVTGTFYHP